MPEIRADEHDWRRANFVFARSEESTNHGLHAQQGKKFRRDKLRVEFLRFTQAVEREAGAACDGYRRKAAIVVPPIAEIGIGNRAGSEIGLALVEHNELLGMRIGNRIEQHGVDDGEEGSVRADAERQSEDGDGGEARTFAQCPSGEARILSTFVEPTPAPLVPRDVFDQWNIAEFPARYCIGVV